MRADILDQIVAQRIERRAREGSAQGIRDLEILGCTDRTPLPFPDSLICEVKRRSPSRGAFAAEGTFDPVAQAKRYVETGPCTLSVLTEQDHFGGGLRDLIAIRRALPNTAILRKDFLIDSEDIRVSRMVGADAVLLIAAILSRNDLDTMLRETKRHGMTALVEVHDVEDLEKARPLQPRVLGINSRDLRTFRVDILSPPALAARVDWPCILVFESGIFEEEDALVARDAGFSSLLVGEALMKDPSRASRLRAVMETVRPLEIGPTTAQGGAAPHGEITAQGGAAAQGPATAQGGAAAQGPTTAQGGAAPHGETTAQGGAAPQGPATAQGGAAPQGPATAQGGAAAQGPATAQGGAAAQGPTTTQGGAAAQGPATAQGGAAPQGFTTTQGGAAPQGETTAQGGAAAQGPTTAQGGAAAQGPTTTQGGAAAQGPATAQGGAAAQSPTTAQGGAAAQGPTTAQGAAAPHGETTAQGGAAPQGPTTAQGGAAAQGLTTAQGGAGVRRPFWSALAVARHRRRERSPGRPLVKVCGITNREDAELARDLGADLLGLIYAPSPRTAPEGLARELARDIGVPLVGVVVESAPAVGNTKAQSSAPAAVGGEEADRSALLARARADLAAGHLAALQLHGEAEPEGAIVFGWPYYKAIRPSDSTAARDAILRYRSPRVLVDAFDRERAGGTGKRVNEEILEAVRIAIAERPQGALWLAGGIDPENVAEVVRRFRPELIDASSGLETQPGKKDPDLMRRFFERIDRASEEE